jgi:hypothetical protein
LTGEVDVEDGGMPEAAFDSGMVDQYRELCLENNPAVFPDLLRGRSAKLMKRILFKASLTLQGMWPRNPRSCS